MYENRSEFSSFFVFMVRFVLKGPLLFFLSPTDAFLGPVCDYVIAPIARYAGSWKIPVLTAAALAENFQFKPLYYQTLTRMMGSYKLVGETLKQILHVFGWRIVGFLFHNFDMTSSKGNSMCYFTLSAVYTAMNKTPVHKTFDEDKATLTKLKESLLFVTKSARSKNKNSLYQ